MSRRTTATCPRRLPDARPRSRGGATSWAGALLAGALGAPVAHAQPGPAAPVAAATASSPTATPPEASAPAVNTAPSTPPAGPVFQPGTWKAGDWTVTPQVGLASGYNDNLRSQSFFPIRSPFVALMPEVTATRADGDGRDELAWRADLTRFTRSHDDDTVNTEAAVSGLRGIDDRTAVAWRVGFQEGHDALGIALPDEPAQSPDHFRAAAAGAIWRHDAGAEGRQRLELEPTVSRKRYVNHRDTTEGADTDTASVVGRWLWQRDTSTRAGLELRLVRVLYPTDTGVLTHNEGRALAVLQSDARPASGPDAHDAGVASGSLALGWQRRQFAAGRPPYAGAAWDAAWQWAAPAGTTWGLSSQRGASDSPGEGSDEVVATRVAFNVTTDWSAAWHTGLSASHTHDRFVNAPFPRDDVVRAVDLSLRRDLSRAWQVAVNLGWSHRDSQVPILDFTRHLWSVVVTAAL